MGNTIGTFIAPFVLRIHALGGKVYVNPDGLEWKRSKWSKPVQAYLKYAEKSMAKTVDLVISDNIGIENYIKESYPDAKTRFIAYGTDLKKSTLTADDYKVRKCFDNWKTKENGYYLIVGRFVPENNYETEKSFSRYCYCHFHYIIIVLVIGSRGYETLVVGYGSFRGTTILRLILTGFG